MSLCVVTVGDPFNGLSLLGPFTSHEEATGWSANRYT
jgi:hypothetical protein